MLRSEGVVVYQVYDVHHIDRDKVADLIRNALEEHFKDAFVFDPIVVVPRPDLDGGSYLRAYVVFDGDFERLDPKFTGRMLTMIEPELIELGLRNVMGLSFVERSEWEEVHEGHDYRESVLLS